MHHRLRGRSSAPSQPPVPKEHHIGDLLSASERNKHNLRVLQRHDPSIEAIIDQVSSVSLYHLEEDYQTWTKSGIVGPTFMFTRKGTPRYGYFILNAQGTGTFKQFMTADDSLELNSKMVIHRYLGPNDGNMPVGLWIWESPDRDQIVQMILRVHLCLRLGIDVPVKWQPLNQPPQPAQSSVDALFAAFMPTPDTAVSPSPLDAQYEMIDGVVGDAIAVQEVGGAWAKGISHPPPNGWPDGWVPLDAGRGLWNDSLTDLGEPTEESTPASKSRRNRRRNRGKMAEHRDLDSSPTDQRSQRSTPPPTLQHNVLTGDVLANLLALPPIAHAPSPAPSTLRPAQTPLCPTPGQGNARPQTPSKGVQTSSTSRGPPPAQSPPGPPTSAKKSRNRRGRRRLNRVASSEQDEEAFGSQEQGQEEQSQLAPPLPHASPAHSFQYSSHDQSIELVDDRSFETSGDEAGGFRSRSPSPAPQTPPPPPQRSQRSKQPARNANGKKDPGYIPRHDPDEAVSKLTRADIRDAIVEALVPNPSPNSKGKRRGKPSSTTVVNGREAVLDRTVFVQELLTLIHTDKEFVTDLHKKYLSKF